MQYDTIKMNEKIYPIIYNKDHYAVVANDVIRGKQEMTLQEAKLLRLLITQVVKEDKDLKTYTCKIQDLANFLGISSQNLYRDIRDICKNLLKRVVEIGTGNPKEPWQAFQWVQMAKYDGKSQVTLMLSEQLKPFVVQLDKYFTQYKLKNILEVQSFYALRLYELLKADDFKTDEYRRYSLSFLRDFFNCNDKYPLFGNFKKRVIEIAVREINDKTDIYINPDFIKYKKTGKKVTSICFYISENLKNWGKERQEEL